MIPQDDSRIVVALVISNMEYGGAQRQIVELVNHSDHERFEFHLVSLSTYMPLAEAIDRSKCQVHVIEKKGKYDFSVAYRIAGLLRKVKADVVHGYLFDAEIAARLAGKLAGTRAVGGSERNTNYHIKKIQRITYFLTNPLMDFCIANSQSGAEYNCRELNIPPERYYTVHNGVDTERFKPRDRQQARSRLDIDERGFLIGMFGSFKAQKNHAMLLDAFEQHLQERPESRLLIVGDQLAGGMHGSDEYARQIQSRLASGVLKQRCIVLGNQKDVEAVYPACDVTALPSLFEGTPNVALESMACGVPVIATDVSDNSLIITEGSTGHLVPLHDAAAMSQRFNELGTNPARCAELGAAARQSMIDRFSCQRLAEKMQTAYLDALGEPAPGAQQLRSFS